MVSDSLKYYRSSGKGWICIAILGLCVVGIIYAVCASNISVAVQGAYDVRVKVGEGATTINVKNYVTERTGI